MREGLCLGRTARVLVTLLWTRGYCGGPSLYLFLCLNHFVTQQQQQGGSATVRGHT